MGVIADTAKGVYRDYAVDSLPASGPFDPIKSDIRSLFAITDAALASVVVGSAIGNAVVYATRAALFADLVHPVNLLGVVYGDPDPDLSGIYRKLGASGAGSWELTDISLPSSFVESATILSKLTSRGNWGPGQDYVIDNVVANGGILYVAAENHTSAASFAADFAAQKWTVFASQSFSIPEGSIPNNKMEVMPGRTVKANAGISPLAPQDVSIDDFFSLLDASKVTTALGYSPMNPAVMALGGGSNALGFQAAGSALVETVQAKLREKVSLKSFMYAVDASASTGLQRALDYIKTNGGGTLTIPSDTVYNCALPVVYSALVPLRIEGDGSVTTTTISDTNQAILRYTGAAAAGPMLTIESSSPIPATSLNGFEIEGIQFTVASGQAKASGGVGLCLRGVYTFRIVNTEMTGFATGLLTDDNPSGLPSGSTRCGAGYVEHLKISRAAKVRWDCRGTCDVTFVAPRLIEESTAGYDADMIIQKGTRGGRSDGITVLGGAFIGGPGPVNNLRVLDDSLFINFFGTAFEGSLSAGVYVQTSVFFANVSNVTLRDCWWDGHTGYCGDFLNSRVSVINPRGSNYPAGTPANLPCFRFRGSTSPSQPDIGGGVFGGVVAFTGPTGIEIDNAAGVTVSEVECFDYSGSGKPMITFGPNAADCYSLYNRNTGVTGPVLDLGPLNTIITELGNKLRGGPSTGVRYKYTGTLNGSGVAVFPHGLVSPHLNIIDVRGQCRSGAGAASPLVWTYTDGSNIAISGPPGFAYTAYVEIEA